MFIDLNTDHTETLTTFKGGKILFKDDDMIMLHEFPENGKWKQKDEEMSCACPADTGISPLCNTIPFKLILFFNSYHSKHVMSLFNKTIGFSFRNVSVRILFPILCYLSANAEFNLLFTNADLFI